MAVLLIIMVGVVAIVGGVSGTTTAERRHLSSDNEARRVFDRMASDFARMIKREDADAVFASIKNGSQGANDKMFFYSEAPAYFNTAGQTQCTAGLIGYRIPNDNSDDSVTKNRWQLERLGKGLTWDIAAAGALPGAMVFLTFPAATTAVPTPTPYPTSTLAGVSTGPGTWNGTGAWSATIGTDQNFDKGVDASYHVLSSDVFRLEYCFVLKNPTTASQYTTSLTQGQGFSKVAAIIVGIALLDAQGRALLPAGMSMNQLAGALPDPDFTAAPPNRLMAELWAAKLNAPGAAASLGVPQRLFSQIRVYQRTFPLNNP